MRAFSALLASTFLMFLGLAATPAHGQQIPFGTRGFPPSYYGWPLDEYAAGYFGGGRYTHYYAYRRGVGIADFPGPVPTYPYPWFGPGKRMPVGGQAVPLHAEYAAPVGIVVWVPADAEVWVDGAKTTSTGEGRLFVSPPLDPGVRHTYEIRARWTGSDGQPVDQTQIVGVFAGDRAVVRFPVAGASGAVRPPAE
jgi:uncharacterized protein (TIGR03000 family)